MALRAEDVMQPKIRTVRAELPLIELERAFLEAKVSGFPVVEKGRLVGVVSRSDVVRHLVAEQTLAELQSDYYCDLSGFDVAPAETLEKIASRAGARLETLVVKDVMTHSPVTVSPDDSVSQVARLLVERGIHRVLVTRDGALVGIVTSLDLADLIADGRVAEG